MADTRLLDIVIVNWNSGEMVGRCIRSIYDAVKGIDYNIIVVDNGSSDGSVRTLPAGERDRLYTLDSNLGFSKACNLGASYGRSEYLLFLNPDTIIKPDSIELAMKVFSNHPGAGIIGVRQITAGGKLLPSCSRFFRLKNLFSDITGLSKIFPSSFKTATIMKEWDHSSSRAVDQVMGSFNLMRRSDFEMAGGFDEQFFVYFEDMDLALRFLRKGLYSYYVNEAAIIHTGCGTTDSIKAERLFYSLSSRIKYSRKHLLHTEALFVTIFTIFPESVIRLLVNLIFKLNIGESISVIKGYYYLIRWFLKRN